MKGTAKHDINYRHYELPNAREDISGVTQSTSYYASTDNQELKFSTMHLEVTKVIRMVIWCQFRHPEDLLIKPCFLTKRD